MRSSDNLGLKPAPILKRENALKYQKPQPFVPLAFDIEEERASSKGTATLVITHRVQAIPKMEELYDSVSKKLGVPGELFRLFRRNSEREFVEIDSDQEVSLCVAEAGGSGAVPRLTVVVIQVGWLGKICISIGGTVLALHRSGRRVCRRLGNTISRYVDSSSFNSPTSIKLPWQQSSILQPHHFALIVCAGGSLSFLLCGILVDRVRAGTPRMAYKPTRQLVALSKARTSSMGRQN
jgi:hypothetical protein